MKSTNYLDQNGEISNQALHLLKKQHKGHNGRIIKSLKRILCGILCLSFLLTAVACGNEGNREGSNGTKNGKPVAMGRYIEEDIEMPKDIGDIIGLQQSPDGSFDLFSRVMDIKDGTVTDFSYFRSTDGKTWEKQDTAWMDSLKNDQGNYPRIRAISKSDAGIIYLLVYHAEKGLQLFQTTDQKTATELVIPSWNEPLKSDNGMHFADGIVTESNSSTGIYAGENNEPVVNAGLSLSPMDMLVLENGDLLIGYYSNDIFRYDAKTGAVLKEYKLNSIAQFFTQGDKLYALSYEGKLTDYDLSTGAEGVTVNVINADMLNAVFSVDKNGNLLTATKVGIQRIVSGGSIWETIVDGNLSSLSIPSLYLSKFLIAENAEGTMSDFYLLFSNGSLKYCHYDDETPSVPDKELTVYALKDNNTVRQAIGEFRQSHPDVMVNFQIGMPEEGAATVSDIIRSLNTEILAGKGPDILILDGLPIESYMEKGVLMDLTSLLSELNDDSALLDTIAKTYAKDGKTFAVPAKVNIPMMLGTEELLGKLDSLAALAADGSDNLLPVTDATSFLLSQTTASYPAWINDEGGIDETKLIEFLTSMKRIYDKYKPVPVDGESSINSIVLSSFTTGQSGQALELDSSMMKFVMGNTKLWMGDISAFDYLTFMLRSNLTSLRPKKDQPETLPEKRTAKPAVGQAINTFAPTVVAGMNNAGKQKELASDFIKTLLSQKVQNYSFNDGFPINAAALDHIIKEGSTIHMPDSDPQVADYGFDLKKIVSGLDKAVSPDAVLLDVILTEGASALDGKKTVEQAVLDIVSNTKIYLAE